MTGPLTRTTAGAGPARPVRLVHLGLGNFSRAHQAWYTDRAADAAEWGYAAFSGRSARLPEVLTAQEGMYTVVERAASGDRATVVGSISVARAGTDSASWLQSLADPAVTVLTLTVTEAGYHASSVDAVADAAMAADVSAVRAGRCADVRTVPGRVLAGLRARRAAGAGPLTVVPCDNLPDNGGVLRRVVTGLADAADPDLGDWIRANVAFVTTMVDRITPASTAADPAAATALTGFVDRAPVITEPFTEWVLAGEFASARPDWASAGARFVTDIEPYEQRKLRLLNGGHSLLAYLGGVLGLRTVADAVADVTCRTALEAWWDLAAPTVDLPMSELADYRAALLQRFENPRIEHRLAQIAVDGSQKLPVRVLPVLRRVLQDGRSVDPAALILAAWIAHLRAVDEIRDVRAADLRDAADGDLGGAVPRLLALLDPDLPDVTGLAAQVVELVAEFTPPNTALRPARGEL